MKRQGEMIDFPGIAGNSVDCEVLATSIPLFSGFGEFMAIDLTPGPGPQRY